MVVEPTELTSSTSTAVNTADDLRTLCAGWISNHSDTATSPIFSRGSHGVDASSYSVTHRPSHFVVWTMGLSFVTIISLCALVGILFMKLMKKSIFDKFITFFVSVGVGSLSGSAVFHLLPQAFGLVEEFDANASHAYLSQSFAAVTGIYLFFFSDKLIKIILETKKRKRLDSTEMERIADASLKSAVVDVERNGAGGVANDTSKKGSSACTDYTYNNSVDAHLLALEKRAPHAVVEAQKPHSHNSEGDESYNRQVHSICVHDHDMQYKEGDSVIATVAWMIIFGDGLHNLIDGISIGASFSESILSGLSVSLAVICEEFPHELGDLAILVSAGMTLRQALVYNLLSALSCYFGFAIGVLVGNLDETFASYTFGFAGGMFLYISMACMMPEMKNAMEEALSRSLSAGLEVLTLQAGGVICGLCVMAFMARYGGTITLATT